MQTSCPECGTTFRVTQEQLGLRRGLVRCGKCNAVFNAYDTLLPELEGAPPVPQHEMESEAPPLDRPATDEAMESPAEAAGGGSGESPVQTDIWAEVQAELDVPSDLPDVPPRDALALYMETAAIPLPQEPEAIGEGAAHLTEMAAETESPDAILLSDLPTRQVAKAGLPKWKAALYLLALLVLTTALAAQLAYFLRGELAAAMPETRPFLDALCRPLGCVVPLPKQLTRQAIVSSSLEHDAEQKSRVRLSFLLANRTHQTQTWPHILLTLSDVRESPVAQKAFPPEEYLPRGVSARAGFPPQSEQEARLELDIGNLAAASYLLNIAYP